MKRKILLVIMLLLSFMTFSQIESSAKESSDSTIVYVIPVENEVERGLLAIMKRGFKEAEENFADYIVLEINSPGGEVMAARDIATLMSNTDIPIVAYVLNQAASAGSYIALNADQIYFRPAGNMGASGIITGDGNAADLKAQSYWIAAMRAAAEAHGRDPIYAEAMANKDVDLPEYGAPKGQFLTLTAQQALEVGYAEGIVDSRSELIKALGITNPKVVEIKPTISEEIARFITNPIVIPILLSIASIGLIVELYSPGFGLPGIAGLSALVLFFYGHLVAGLAGYESLILLLVGLICIILEIFVPSGILGIIGAGAIIGALVVSGADMGHMAFSIGIAILVAIVLAIVLFKKIDVNKGIFRHLVLKDSTSTEKGYISNVNRLDLLGKEGYTLTFLRPAGTAVFDDDRIDVVTEGTFIDRNKKVKIVKVEGSRIVVREVNDED